MSDTNVQTEAAAHSETQEIKAALYCRTARQDDNAIEIQRDRARSFAEEKGYTNPCCYIDNGESGSTLDRPAMKRLIDDIKYGEIGVVVVASADRIARGIIPMAEWMCLLEENNVSCISPCTREQDMRKEFALWFDITRCFCPEIIEKTKRMGFSLHALKHGA